MLLPVPVPASDPAELRFALVHSRDRILPELSESLGAYSLRKLEARGLLVRARQQRCYRLRATSAGSLSSSPR